MALTPQQLKELREAPPVVNNRVQRAIDLAGETQTSLAKAIGLPYTYVSDTARGRYNTITVENARKFADFFGCAIEDLFPRQERKRVSA